MSGSFGVPGDRLSLDLDAPWPVATRAVRPKRNATSYTPGSIETCSKCPFMKVRPVGPGRDRVETRYRMPADSREELDDAEPARSTCSHGLYRRSAPEPYPRTADGVRRTRSENRHRACGILRNVSRASPNRSAAARSLSPPHRCCAAPRHRGHPDTTLPCSTPHPGVLCGPLERSGFAPSAGRFQPSFCRQFCSAVPTRRCRSQIRGFDVLL